MILLDSFVVNTLVFTLCVYLVAQSVDLFVKAWRAYRFERKSRPSRPKESEE